MDSIIAPRRELTAERVWLTPEQAVRYLGLPSLKALYQAVRRGTVPVCRIGRALRFFRHNLDQALL
ncbi:MAG: helix-turn-helix domain-containing protein, partial [Myxococcaceae bacterium]